MTTITLLEAILTNGTRKGPYELFFGKLPKYARHLKTFGEVGVTAKLNRKMSGKLEDKGNVSIFIS